MGLLELFFPDLCAACGALCRPAGLCERCRESLYPPAPVTCRRCRRAPPPFARVVAPWRYGGELATAVRRFKYGGERGGTQELAHPLAALLAPALPRDVDL